MKHVIILASFSTLLLLGACEKDIITTTTEELVANEQIESTEDLSLRKGNYKSMAELRSQFQSVIDEPTNHISAAWTADENIGLIIGRKYAVINRLTGEMIKGNLKEAVEFWNNAPFVFDAEGAHHPTKIWHNTKLKTTGITAGWTYGDLIGFTSNNAFWYSYISRFNDPNVWKDNTSVGGLLHHNDFWKESGIGENAVTAGFFGPKNLFFAFSGTKILAHSSEKNKWILNKEISDLQPNDPLYFLKKAPLPQLKEINAAFYNEGANEYVFMSELAWAAYSVTSNNWSYGSLSSCFDAQEAVKQLPCTKEYWPVCGCDGKTYDNKCLAEDVGITSFVNCW